MSSTEVFNNFLLTVSRLTGSDSVSLFIFNNSDQHVITLLAHEGKFELILELENRIKTSEVVSRSRGDTRSNKSVSNLTVIPAYPGTMDNAFLIRIPIAGSTLETVLQKDFHASSDRRKAESGQLQSQINQSIWVELRFDHGADTTLVQQLDNVVPTILMPDNKIEWMAQTLRAGAQMVLDASKLSSLLRDPVSLLGGRAEFQLQLKQEFNLAKMHEQSLSLLLVNPDDFASINQRFDQKIGDQALAEVAGKLRGCLRSSDAVYRYGGAIFAVILPHTGLTDATDASKKITNIMTGPYLDGALRLAFSVGVTAYDINTEDDDLDNENDLLRQADYALNLAKRAGGGRAVVWNNQGSDESIDYLDRLSGIFTANTEKDYRNMLLLWDTIAIISSGEETEKVASDFVDRVQSTLKADKVWLFTNDDDRYLLLADSKVKDHQHAIENRYCAPVLSEQQITLLTKVKKQQRSKQTLLSAIEDEDGENRDTVAYAVPLVARNQYMGCLYMDGQVDTLSLDSSDLVFMNALASQIALVLDRAELALRWKQEKELESKLLREEVHELRQVFRQELNGSSFIYRSPEMQSVLDVLQVVAETDVTVLITGESGTGKEMLAQMIHEKSTRKEKPFVTVDCSSIAHSLMETELFGYVKGAYTGAVGTSEGRIEQADGGTLFLDEIGEIPLDVQAKLLRFVQEKEISPVGATRSRVVDVRIVAATNRNLAREVAEGRFRGDLYYRLKVVTLTSPALRDRPTDIIHLAQYFIEKFSAQYEKGFRQLTPEAVNLLQDFRWPGNVRELQNSILRAVILSTSEKIDIDHIHLLDERIDTVKQTVDGRDERAKLSEITEMHPVGGVNAMSTGQLEVADIDILDPWQALHQNLENQISRALYDKTVIPFPLGQWLTEDLVLTADKATNGVSRRASARLGVAETTYRRQLEKVKLADRMGMLTRTPDWAEINPILSDLIATSKASEGKNILEASKQLLLSIVATQVNNDFSLGSSLMGVTKLTYQRWTTLQFEKT